MVGLRRKPGLLFWKLFFGNAALVVVVLGASVWIILAEVDRFYSRELTTFLESQARTLAAVAGDDFSPARARELATLASKVGTNAAEGVRVGPEDGPQGVVRVAMRVQSIGERIGPTRRVMWTILLVGLFASVALALGLARLWSARIARLTVAARSLSRGDLEGHIETDGRDEIALLAKSLNRMRDNLVRTIRIKSDFVANASHELRTPLSAIRAAVETVMNLNLPEEAESAGRFLKVIDRHSARLEALVEDLLVLSRVETTAGRFAPTELDLNQVFQLLQERWSPVAKDGGVELTCDAAPDARSVVADSHLLQLVLDNLVDNAIKFTGAGGHVGVAARRDRDRLAIIVSDDGCGIAPEEHQRVFERFYQVERARSETGRGGGILRGTGLGLSIVRHAAAAMNGTVSLTSQVGSGTQVTLSIPRKPPPLRERIEP